MIAYFHEMGYLSDHPSQFWRILPDYSSIHLGQSQTAKGSAVFGGSAYSTFDQGNSEHFFFIHRDYLISVMVLPLFWAIISGL